MSCNFLRLPPQRTLAQPAVGESNRNRTLLLQAKRFGGRSCRFRRIPPPSLSEEILLTREANTKKRDPGGCDLVFVTCLDPKHLSILSGDGAGTFRSRAPKHPLPQAATNLPWLCTLLRRVEGEQTNLSACGKCYLLPIVDDHKSWNPTAHHTCPVVFR